MNHLLKLFTLVFFLSSVAAASASPSTEQTTEEEASSPSQVAPTATPAATPVTPSPSSPASSSASFPAFPVLATPAAPEASTTPPASKDAAVTFPPPPFKPESAAPVAPETPPELISPQFELTPIEAISGVSRNVVAVAPPLDLWDRIRRGYSMPNLNTDLVRDREQWYLRNPDAVFQMSERSRKYLFHIVEELELRNMPTELALLPFVESEFNPQAVSRANAVGIWQFMPATGRYFSLKQTAFRDDRRDVLASTRAALDYLQKLYAQFGDWHLALAAYNWGSGRVSRAISSRSGLRPAYTDLAMPMETRMYVPKLQAMKNIVFNPAAYGARLPDIGNHPYFQSVTINRDMDMQTVAQLADVSVADFKALNPSLTRSVILAASTPQILLPWDNAEKFQSNLEAYGGGKLASWTVWVAPSNLRASEAAKMVGMTENDFRQANGIPPHMLIKAGSPLLVPRTTNGAQDVGAQLADSGQLALAPEAAPTTHNVRGKQGKRGKGAAHSKTQVAQSSTKATKASKSTGRTSGRKAIRLAKH